MEIINQYHYAAAILIARLFLGFLFFFQGYDAVFKIKIKNVVETYQITFQKSGIAKILTVCGAWFTSCTALICGFLLVIGLFECLSLYLLGINLIITAIGFGINTAMWDTRFVFPRLLLLLLLLLVPPNWDLWSFDNLFFKP